MTGWCSALQDATAGKRRPAPSIALAAVALDEAEVSVEDIGAGTSILIATSRPLRDAIDILVRTVHVGERPADSEPWDKSPCCITIVRDPRREPGWQLEAADAGQAALVIVGEIDDVQPRSVLAIADRRVEVGNRFQPGDLEAAIVLVTGDHVELEDWWPVLKLEDAAPCLTAGSKAVECASRLWKLVQSRESAEREAQEDERDMLARLAEPAPLGKAAAGVVRRLSQMTGFGDAGRWGMQLAADLRAYGEGRLAWSEVDRGVLLSGPPGSGKTTFAKALAMEAGVELVASGYGDLANGTTSDIAKLMAKKFDTWREKAAKAPIIVLIDEIDTLGVRGRNAHNDSYWGGVINAMLAFLDGAVPRAGIVVVAATNHPSNVDPALLRPGRLDRRIELPYPGPEAMAGILRHHLGPDAVVDEAELSRAAKLCRGMSPAEVEQTCREARRVARVHFGRRVACDDVCLVLGARRLEALQRPGAAALDRRIAVHEAGHAISMLAAPSETLLHVDMDQATTWAEGHVSLTLSDAEAQMTVLLAGLAAEQLILGDHASGVSRDLRQATELAMTCHARWGMGVLGFRSADDEGLSDPAILAAVDAILVAAHARARALVTESREAVLRLAGRLQQDRYLDAAEVRAIVDDPRPAPERTAYGDRVARTIGRRGRHPDPTP